ncbi:MAG: alpha/beta hydrolase [Segetibacter sp.]
MSYFEHNDLSFYYTETGHGTPFIFQHGLGGSVDQIIKIYSPPSGVRLITFDFRGHGKTQMSRKEELNFKTFADDVLAFMSHLLVDKAIIGGISMGAGVALNFALRYPDRTLALILSRPAWLDRPMEKQNKEIYSFIAKLLRENGHEKGRQIFIASDLYTQLSIVSPTTAQSFLGHFNYERASETAVKYELLPEDAPIDSRSEWKKITAPMLILANKSDPVHPFEYGLEYASAIGHADFKEITSKSINEEQHNKDVKKYIDMFINKILDRSHSP